MFVAGFLSFDNQYYFYSIPYILPILILYTRFDLDFFRSLFYYSYILLLLSILISTYTAFSGEDSGGETSRVMLFNIGGSFILITSQFSKKKGIFYTVVIYYMLLIVLVLKLGRRGMFVEYILLMVTMILFRLKSQLLLLYDRMIMYFIGLLFVIFIIAYGYSSFASSYAFQRGLSAEGFEESRGDVFEAFFYDFGSASDWIFGRGINGSVLRSFLSDSRYSGIENGFLTILLKGGLLYSIPFLIIMLAACFLGLFRSNNDVVKAMAALLLIYLIMMSYFNVPWFSTQYTFMWISISVCFTEKMRKHSNEEIYKIINIPLKQD